MFRYSLVIFALALGCGSMQNHMASPTDAEWAAKNDESKAKPVPTSNDQTDETTSESSSGSDEDSASLSNRLHPTWRVRSKAVLPGPSVWTRAAIRSNALRTRTAVRDFTAASTLTAVRASRSASTAARRSRRP